MPSLLRCRRPKIRYLSTFVLSISLINGLSYQSLSFCQICHKTCNKKCPWMDILIAPSAVAPHMNHGDKSGSCASTCAGCDEWDEASCQCVYVSCKPTHAPSLSPTTKNPTLTPSEYPSESPSSLGKSGKFPTYIPASPGPTDFPTKSPILHPTNDDDVR
jgi:hypothetical protein